MARKVLVVAVGLLASACSLGGLGRHSLMLPVEEPDLSVPSRGEIYVGPVVDARKFEEKPATKSTPSAKHNDADKEILIGRQQNGLGMDAGDVALKKGQTVTERVRAMVRLGLSRRGYAVTDNPQARCSVAVTVDEFWSWFDTKGMDFIFNSSIGARLVVKRGDKSTGLYADGHGTNADSTNKNSAWLKSFENAIGDFQAHLDTELAKAGVTASAGDPCAAAKPAASGTRPPATGDDLETKLKKLKALREQGLITEGEYEAKRKALLDSM